MTVVVMVSSGGCVCPSARVILCVREEGFGAKERNCLIWLSMRCLQDSLKYQ